jgi:glutaredoxin 3
MGAGQSASSEGTMAAKQLIQKAIASNPVYMISSPWCPFCRKAKQALDEVGAAGKYTVQELDQLTPDQGSAAEWKEAMRALIGKSSVPQVFIAGEHIGGGDETAAAKRSGQLEAKLKAAGVI